MKTPQIRLMEDSRVSATDYLVRRGEISAYGRALASTKRLLLLIVFVGCVFTALVLLLLFTAWPISSNAQLVIIATLFLFIVVALAAIYLYVRRHFIEPDLAFRLWLQQVCDGNLDARIGLDKQHHHYKELNFHTLNLASSLRRLSDDMDSLVESQTKKLSEQKSVVELLFKLTADVASETQDRAAFVTVCQYVAEWFGAVRVSCYKVIDEQSKLCCVATFSANDVGNDSSAACAIDKPDFDVVTLEQIPQKISNFKSADKTGISSVWVPFFAGDQVAGVLIVERDGTAKSEHSENQRILTTVSEQLSLLCNQQIVQEQVLQTRLSRDRNELAAEIHDSLAQTLLAIRYQATLLSEKLKSEDISGASQDVVKINGSIEEANEEVRGLIREYRSPLAEHRYADALQVAIDQFSQSTGIAVFFQSDDPQIRFTPREESALQRIIGESLNNARKYADASMIRVYLNSESSGVRRILVEDDGIGFNLSAINEPSLAQSKDRANQIGLTIMQERALSIGAKLTIDSERGEGTRIAISMPPLIEPRRDSA